LFIYADKEVRKFFLYVSYSQITESMTSLKLYLESTDNKNEKLVLLYLTIFDVGGHHEN